MNQQKYPFLTKRIHWAMKIFALFCFCQSLCLKALAQSTPEYLQPQSANSLQKIHLLFLAQLSGTFEPCGCTQQPKGGLEYIAAAIADFKQQHSGDSIYPVILGRSLTSADRSLQAKQTAKLSAEIIWQFLKELQPIYMTFRHEPYLPESLQQLTKRHQQPSWLAPSNLQSTTTAIASHHLLLTWLDLSNNNLHKQPRHGDEIGDKTKYKNKYTPQLTFAWQGETSFNLDAAIAKEVDFIFRLQDKPQKVQNNKKPIFLDLGQRGEYLSVLTLYLPKEAVFSQPIHWQAFQEEDSDKEALQQSIDLLQKQLSYLPEGPAKKARQQRLEQLQQQSTEQKKDPTKQPQPYSWQYQHLPIQRSSPLANSANDWAVQLIDTFHDKLCQSTVLDEAELHCLEDANSPAYLGTMTCQGCHSAAFTVYQQSQHAKAWATLQASHHTCDIGCIGCHSVGYQQINGYCKVSKVQPFENVGCENCHGPAGFHVKYLSEPAKWGERFIRKPSLQQCLSCHVPSHSDAFDYERYKKQIIGPGHGLPLPSKP